MAADMPSVNLNKLADPIRKSYCRIVREITLRQLRVVSALARTRRTHAAADALGVTGPAVTLQLKLLEDGFGMPLFERTRDGMNPTAAGLRVLDAAHRIENVLATCREEVARLADLDGETVSVGVVSTAKYFAPSVLGAFRHEYPNIAIKLFVRNREETIRGLGELEYDLAIMGRPPDTLETEDVEIGEHPHVVIAPLDHHLALRTRIPLRALEAETFLTREPGSGTRILMEQMFANAKIRPTIGMEIDSNETIKQAVIAGLGIAFISAHTIAVELEARKLVVLDVAGLPLMRSWRIVRPAKKRLTPAAAALRDFLIVHAVRHLPHIPQAGHAQARPSGRRGDL